MFFVHHKRPNTKELLLCQHSLISSLEILFVFFNDYKIVLRWILFWENYILRVLFVVIVAVISSGLSSLTALLASVVIAAAIELVI